MPNPFGQRIAKLTEHGKIHYILDNDQLIGEYQHSEYTWYIKLPNQFHSVALIKQGELYYYHLDQLNTPRFLTNSNAEVAWQNQADLYGSEEPETDMAHKPMHAVKYWNTTGRKHGDKSKEVRERMLDSNNYTLDHYSLNRSAGAKLKDRYEPPLG